MSNNIERRIADKLFPKEKPMQRARAWKVDTEERKAAATIQKIKDKLGL